VSSYQLLGSGERLMSFEQHPQARLQAQNNNSRGSPLGGQGCECVIRQGSVQVGQGEKYTKLLIGCSPLVWLQPPPLLHSACRWTDGMQGRRQRVCHRRQLVVCWQAD
jgi:hypothetical protein